MWAAHAMEKRSGQGTKRLIAGEAPVANLTLSLGEAVLNEVGAVVRRLAGVLQADNLAPLGAKRCSLCAKRSSLCVCRVKRLPRFGYLLGGEGRHG